MRRVREVFCLSETSGFYPSFTIRRAGQALIKTDEALTFRTVTVPLWHYSFRRCFKDA